MYTNRKRAGISTCPSSVYFNDILSDKVEVEDRNRSVEVVTNHSLAVAGHYALTWSEVLLSVDDWRKDERNVWCVDITGLKERITL